MAYNNFLLRLLFSSFIVTIYFMCAYINFKYVFYLIVLIYFLIFIEIYLFFKLYKLLPLIYILISFLFFFSINFEDEIFLNFNLFIIIVVTFDMFSYVIGNLFGKKKLIKISPNKTYEGLLGGLISSIFISLIFSHYFNIAINIKLLIFILIIIISAFLGDIIESFYKRKNNLKNSSELIPGHGGVFDRFDSFSFSIIFYSISINI